MSKKQPMSFLIKKPTSICRSELPSIKAQKYFSCKNRRLKFSRLSWPPTSLSKMISGAASSMTATSQRILRSGLFSKMAEDKLAHSCSFMRVCDSVSGVSDRINRFSALSVRNVKSLFCFAIVINIKEKKSSSKHSIYLTRIIHSCENELRVLE